MQSTVYIGIDWSITSPAITVLDERGDVRHHIFIEQPAKRGVTCPAMTGCDPVYCPIPYPSYTCNTERFHRLAMSFWTRLPHTTDMKIGIEGYSYSAKGLVFNIAESTGIFKNVVWSYTTIDPTVVPSSHWKKHHGLKGNSDKKPVIDFYIASTGRMLYNDFNVDETRTKGLGVITDIADSWAIARYIYDTEAR